VPRLRRAMKRQKDRSMSCDNIAMKVGVPCACARTDGVCPCTASVCHPASPCETPLRPPQAAEAEHAAAAAGVGNVSPLYGASTPSAAMAMGPLRATAGAPSALAPRGTWMGRKSRSVSWDDLPNKLTEAAHSQKLISTVPLYSTCTRLY